METVFKIFIVEDDLFFNNMLLNFLSENTQLHCSSYFTGSQVLKKISQNPDFIILDYRLTDMVADDIIEKYKSFNPNIKIIILSAQTDIKIATNLMKAGADEYIIKDENALTNLDKVLQSYIKEKQLLELKINSKDQFQNFIQLETFLIGKSHSISNIKKLIIKAAQSNLNVAITGEQGTGKRFIAKVIHVSSKLSHLPLHEIGIHDIEDFEKYIKLESNKSEIIPEDLKKYETGTFFINEISEFNIDLQSKLIKFIKSLKEILRKKEYAGTNAHRFIIGSVFDFQDLLKKKKLNEELYFETLGLKLEIPTLRSRTEDISFISEEFKNEFCRNNGIESKIISNDAKKKLMRYNYPGNIKELKAIIELACVLSDESTITESEIIFNSNAQPTYDLNNSTLSDFNNRFIFNYLKRNDFQVVKTANELGISKSKIYNMLKDGSFNNKN
jgi:two-component system response regulator AtoC